MQTLFEWDFSSKHKDLAEILENLEEFEFPWLGRKKGFALELTSGVIAKMAGLDQIIEKAAPQWPIDQISIVDRNILRIGLYELLFEGIKKAVT